jgi:hypothetical protein
VRKRLARTDFSRLRKDVERFVQDKADLKMLDKDLILRFEQAPIRVPALAGVNPSGLALHWIPAFAGLAFGSFQGHRAVCLMTVPLSCCIENG